MIKYMSILLLIPILLVMISCGMGTKNLPEIEAPITPETALQSYLYNGDDSFQWELKDTYTIGETTAYDILLTSQKWREHLWTHQLTILVPKEVNYDGALLFITGGSAKGVQHHLRVQCGTHAAHQYHRACGRSSGPDVRVEA